MSIPNNETVKRACLIVCLLFAAALAQSVPVSLTIEAEDFSAVQGAAYNPPDDFLDVDSLGKDDWLRYDSVNFLDGGFDSVIVWYYKDEEWKLNGGQVIVRIDSPQGTAIATVALRNFAGQVSVPAGTRLSVRPSGVHSVYLTFSYTGAGYDTPNHICDVDKFSFRGQASANASDAAVYYVSTSGADGNIGTSRDLPFRTIRKAASVMKPGGRCIIRQGIYRETVTPLYTGLAGAPLTFEAYSGENVVICGADPVTGWTNAGIAGMPNIYKTQQMNWSLGRYKDQLLVDGKMAWVARCPNVDDSYTPRSSYTMCWAGYGIYNRKKWQGVAEPIAVSMQVCMVSEGIDGVWNNPLFYVEAWNNESNPVNQLPPALFGRPENFFAGGLVSIAPGYNTKSGLITGSQSRTATTTRIYATRIGVFNTNGGGPAWVSYVLGLLDAPNEWYRDSASSTVYLWAPDGGDPSHHLVEAKRRTLGFDLRGKQYVTLKGLHFLATSASLANASNCVIDGCYFRYVSHNDVPDECDYGAGLNMRTHFDANSGRYGICVTGDHNTIKNTSVIGSAASGIIVGGSFNTITNCRISACNYSPTYNAGILVRPCANFEDTRDALGIKITHNSISFNARANIQIAKSALPTDANERMLIEYNDFGAAVYATQESGSICAQFCSLVEVSHNWFHDVGNWNSANTAFENDIGGVGNIIHHNVMWQGYGPAENSLRGCDWTPDADPRTMVFNNTTVDSVDGLHRDWHYMRTYNADGTLGDVPWPLDKGNNLFGTPNRKNSAVLTSIDTTYWKFTDPVNRDYTLRAGSPAINAGVVVTGMPAGWPNPHANVTDGKPDLGAYEYGEKRWIPGADWQEQSWVYPPADLAGLVPGGPAYRDIGFSHLRIGPGVLIVNLPAGGAYRVMLYDMRGALVLSRSFAQGGAMVIPTQSIPYGIYVLRASNALKHAVQWKICIKR